MLFGLYPLHWKVSLRWLISSLRLPRSQSVLAHWTKHLNIGTHLKKYILFNNSSLPFANYVSHNVTSSAFVEDEGSGALVHIKL
jgi:hypothetical protein